MERVIRRNIIKLYTMAFFEAVMVITAVFVPLLQRHGLSMAEVMQTQAMFAFVVASCEVPSGYLADLWGRKNTIVLGTALCAIGFSWFIFADSFVDFLLMEFLLGVGMSLNSGADLALLYDSQNYLSRNGQPNKTTKLIARLVSMESLAAGLAGVATGILALWSLDLVVYAQALICLVPVGIALTLVEAPRVISVGSHAENALRIREAIIGQPLIPGIVLTLVTVGVAAMLGFWLYQPYWSGRGIPVAWFGYIWAFHCVVVSIGAHFSSWAEDLLGSRKLLVLIAVVILTGFVGMALVDGWWGVCFGFAIGLSRGLNSVILVDGLNKRLSAEFRATVNSLVSLGTRAAFILVGPLLGFVVDGYGAEAAMLVLAVLFAPTMVVVLMILFNGISNEDTAREKETAVTSA